MNAWKAAGVVTLTVVSIFSMARSEDPTPPTQPVPEPVPIIGPIYEHPGVSRPSSPPPNEPASAPAVEPAKERVFPDMPAYWPIGLRRYLDLDRYSETVSLLDYSNRLYSRETTSDGGRGLSMDRHDQGAMLMRAQDWNAYTLAERFHVMDLSTRAHVPGRAPRMPSHLYNTQVEGMVPSPLPFPDAYDFAVGSASDEPFESAHEWTGDYTYMIGGPVDGKNSFLFLLNWANNREFMNRRPYPGLEFRHKEGDDFLMVAGFPYNGLFWRPCEKVEIEAEYQFVRNVHTQAAYMPVKQVKLYGGFDWSNDRYFLADRPDNGDRLFYYEKRLTGGVRWSPKENLYVDFFAGYAFDRMFFEGHRYEDRHDALHVGDGPFIGVQLGVRF